MPGSAAPTFTLFTPTYNRRHTLRRPYESLLAQTSRDFEWVVVDDGSTDGTEDLVRGWAAEGRLPMRYFRQEHRGAHCAMNLGVREAQGMFFSKLDSDDACRPETLARFATLWAEMPPDLREGFAGITGLCENQRGERIGDAFPHSPLDASPPELSYRYKVRGDKFGFLRTSALREHPQPEDVGGNFIPEGVLWHKIAQRYRTRYVNEVFLTVWLDQPSLTRGPSRAAVNAAGHRLLFMSMLNADLPWLRYAPWRFLCGAANYCRFSCHCGVSAPAQWADLHGLGAKLLWFLGAPLGWPLYWRDRLKS